jgi:probable rRNA maturation factor
MTHVTVEAGSLGEVQEEALVAAVERTVSAEGRRLREVSVALLGDADIRALNREFLGHDRPTDVIAFALGEADDLVGDIYLGVDQARRQAEELGVPLAEELVRLAVHGTLHVLGYDHPEGEDRYDSPMFVVQERILRELLEGDPA